MEEIYDRNMVMVFKVPLLIINEGKVKHSLDIEKNEDYMEQI